MAKERSRAITGSQIFHVPDTDLEQKYKAALLCAEATMLRYRVTKIPSNNPKKAQVIVDDLLELMDALGLEFVSQLEPDPTS